VDATVGTEEPICNSYALADDDDADTTDTSVEAREHADADISIQGFVEETRAIPASLQAGRADITEQDEFCVVDS
jgi:hypothetical protein